LRPIGVSPANLRVDFSSADRPTTVTGKEYVGPPTRTITDRVRRQSD
jgi:hypothetical protein